MNSNIPGQMEIRYSFGSAAVICVLPMVALIAYLVFAPPVPRTPHLFIIAFLGGLSVAGLVIAIRRWARKEPLFLIGQEGITDYRTYGLIRWDEITAARLKKTKAGKMLIIDVADPGRFENIKPSLNIRALHLPGDLHLDILETDKRAEDILAEVHRRMQNLDQ